MTHCSENNFNLKNHEKYGCTHTHLSSLRVLEHQQRAEIRTKDEHRRYKNTACILLTSPFCNCVKIPLAFEFFEIFFYISFFKATDHFLAKSLLLIFLYHQSVTKNISHLSYHKPSTFYYKLSLFP